MVIAARKGLEITACQKMASGGMSRMADYRAFWVGWPKFSWYWLLKSMNCWQNEENDQIQFSPVPQHNPVFKLHVGMLERARLIKLAHYWTSFTTASIWGFKWFYIIIKMQVNLTSCADSSQSPELESVRNQQHSSNTCRINHIARQNLFFT